MRQRQTTGFADGQKSRVLGRAAAATSAAIVAIRGADPGVLGEPFVGRAAKRAIGAAEKYRAAMEGRGLDLLARRYGVPCFRTSDHDDAHKPLLLFAWVRLQPLCESTAKAG